MKIRCNDIERDILAATLGEALEELGYGEAIVATALNGEFIPKSQRAQTLLKASDQIDIVAPMQGG